MKKLEFYIHQYIYEICKKKKENGDYKFNWTVDKSDYEEINQLLLSASKNMENKNLGKPDLIYIQSWNTTFDNCGNKK